jgi:DNA polymerase/3'-5' exonuclease PolX
MNLKDAQKIAVDICYRLQPYADRLNIAGSIRRNKPFVNDIEIVCLPKKQPCGQPGLFGEMPEDKSISDFVNIVFHLGVVITGNPHGRSMKIQLPQGIMLDLFMPQAYDYFRIYAIRTGSSVYSQIVIANAWKKKGWCGTENGLRRIVDCIKKSDKAWKVENTDGEKPPVWKSEEEFFNWLDLKYQDPQFREIASSSATHQKETLKNLGL